MILPSECPYCKTEEKVTVLKEGKKASLLEFNNCKNRIVWYNGNNG